MVALDESGGAEFDGVDEVRDAARHLRIVPHWRMRGFCQSILALPSPLPMCTSFCWSRAMEEATAQIMAAAHIDVVHIEHLRAAQYAPSPCSAPRLFDSVDCLTGLFRQLAKGKKNPVSKLVMAQEPGA